MLNERLLGTLLRSLRTHTDLQDTPRLLSTAASLLVSLNNPQNVSLLSSQLLLAPALWMRPDGLSTCLSFMSLFHSAAVAKAKTEQMSSLSSSSPEKRKQLGNPSDLKLQAWVQAIVNGADERSPRWRHAMLLAGLLVGLGADEFADEMSLSLQSELARGLVRSVNLALESERQVDVLPGACLALVLAQCWTDVPERERRGLDYDRLLPVLLGAALFSAEGFESGYFIGVVDADVAQDEDGKLQWPETSRSYAQVKKMQSGPLVSSMGPLAQFIAHTMHSVKDPELLQMAMEDILKFTSIICQQWRVSKLSAVEHLDETRVVEKKGMEKMLTSLWEILKTAFYTVAILLQGLLACTLAVRVFAKKNAAITISTQVLHALRNLYFIHLQTQNQNFSHYTFAYLASIDVVTSYPIDANNFIGEICPKSLGQVSNHPLDKALDLYFLNTAEHFSAVLAPSVNDDILISAALPYLSPDSQCTSKQLYEAAHGVILAIISTPHNEQVAWKVLPFYVEALFTAFPQKLSPRQFRFAMKTIVKTTTVSTPFSETEPLFSEILLEALLNSVDGLTSDRRRLEASEHVDNASLMYDGVHLSAQAVFWLALVDSLPYTSYETLEDWLLCVACSMRNIKDDAIRACCKRHLWTTMTEGEMDIERARLCAIWWTTKGGREMVLDDNWEGLENFEESGSLKGIPRESKL